MNVIGALCHRAETMGARLAAPAAGRVVFPLLNFIPVIGGLISLAAVLLGFGAITRHAARHLSRDDATSEAGIQREESSPNYPA